MPIALPQSVKKLLQDKAYGHVVTFNAQGKSQLTMVWMDVDGDEILFNTAEGRTKLCHRAPGRPASESGSYVTVRPTRRRPPDLR